MSNTKQQFRLLLLISDVVKHYSAYCFAWSAVGPLYGLAGCMNPECVVEVILLPHVAMVVSKQHHYVVETLPIYLST